MSELYDRHRGEDIYVVGSGASMRVFPIEFLADKVTIGLNMAWKDAPVRYAITIGPNLNVPEFVTGAAPHPEITWITKVDKARAVLTPEQFAHADRHFYRFESDGRPNSQPLEEPTDSGRILDWVRRPTGNFLYQWSSISQTAVNLAANLGAANVILVGCDNCALLDNHHAHEQHTKWLGAEPDRRYAQYYEGLAEVRSALRERGVNVLSASPFLKLDAPEADFARLCDELERPALLRGEDISDRDHPSRFLGAAGPGPRRSRRLGRAVRDRWRSRRPGTGRVDPGGPTGA
ncbi:MAG: hypothetical protein ACKOA9_14295 [Actinomycetota bacterium]